MAQDTTHAASAVASEGSPPLPVTIYSDVICPWCYVGKRRFEKALAEPGMPQHVAITWRPFELNPDMPAEGRERAAYRASKFGLEKARRLDQEMTERGREVGIAFAFDKQPRTPNTRLAHRLIWQAERQGREAQNTLVDRLFEAYFEQGIDIGRKDVLIELARAAGLDTHGARVALDEDGSLSAVLDLEATGMNLGIRGVPFFLLIDKYAVSGAQPPEMWQDALPKIAAELRDVGAVSA